MFSASSCTHVRARREIESVRMSCARGVCGLACANGLFTIYCCSYFRSPKLLAKGKVGRGLSSITMVNLIKKGLGQS